MKYNFFANIDRHVESGEFDEKSIAAARRMARSAEAARIMVKSECKETGWEECEEFGGLSVPEIFGQILAESTQSGADGQYHSYAKEMLYYYMASGHNHNDWCFMPDYLQACLESDQWSDGCGSSYLTLFRPLYDKIVEMNSARIESVVQSLDPTAFCLAE